MWTDPIVEEVRKFRQAHSEKFNHDLDAIFLDLKEQERASGRVYVSFPPRPVIDLTLPDGAATNETRDSKESQSEKSLAASDSLVRKTDG